VIDFQWRPSHEEEEHQQGAEREVHQSVGVDVVLGVCIGLIEEDVRFIEPCILDVSLMVLRSVDQEILGVAHHDHEVQRQRTDEHTLLP
jgi:hypothetical protein